MAPPRTVLARNLTFIDGERQVIYPQGTLCQVYNSKLYYDPEAEGLLLRAKGMNAKAGAFVKLVMIINGKPRLLDRGDTCPEKLPGETPPPVAQQPQPKPEPAKPAEEKPVRQQPTLF